MLEKFDIFFFSRRFLKFQGPQPLFSSKARARMRAELAAAAQSRGPAREAPRWLRRAGFPSPRWLRCEGARAAATARGPVGHLRLPLVLFLLFLFPG